MYLELNFKYFNIIIEEYYWRPRWKLTYIMFYDSSRYDSLLLILKKINLNKYIYKRMKIKRSWRNLFSIQRTGRKWKFYIKKMIIIFSKKYFFIKDFITKNETTFIYDIEKSGFTLLAIIAY